MPVPYKEVNSEFPRAKVSYNPQRNIWNLEEDYSYFDKMKKSTINLYKGFQFDLSSIPRFLWGIVGIHELSLEAPLIHDFMYMSKGGAQKCFKNKEILGSIQPEEIFYSREEADKLFLTIMKQAGVSKWRRLLGYIGVRIFGKLYWRPECFDNCFNKIKDVVSETRTKQSQLFKIFGM